MLKNAPDVDCIGIFTQRHLHGPMVIKALKMGKNVYSAVPIGCTLEEIREITELAKDGTIYMMGETCYYYPCAMFCREKYATGEMGKFVYGESQYYHDICEMYHNFQHSGGPNWRRVAGIPPMFYPTHSISMLFSAIGEHALKVSCMGYRDNHEDAIYGEDKNNWQNPFSNETAIFQMSGGGGARINEFRRVGINKPSSYITCMYGEKASYDCSVTGVTGVHHKNEIGSLKSSGALTGKVHSVRSFDPAEMNVEDFSCGMLEFENNAAANFKVAWAANMPESSDIRLGALPYFFFNMR